MSPFTLPRRYMISRAWISMSAAVPPPPACDGWCIMIRACGSAERRPARPPARRKHAMLAANPMQVVCTGACMNCIVS
jgi:hypothetical protein